MELLERAVKALKSGQTPDLDHPLDHGPEIDLQVPALIPDDYLPDVHARLIMYKRIASARSADELRELQVEMIDRFGLLPEPVKTLFRITALKLTATPIGIRKIEAGPRGGRIVFGPEPNINLPKLLELVQKQHVTYKLDGQDKLRINREMPNTEARLREVEGLLETVGVEKSARGDRTGGR
jgi:transcription-repair coupling factor (superfamily II helicase)